MNLQSAICPIPAIATKQPCLHPSLRRKIMLIGRVSVIAVTTVTLPYSFGGNGKLVAAAWAENVNDDSNGIPDVHTNDGTGAPHVQSADNSDASNRDTSSENDSSASRAHDNDESGGDSGNRSDDDTAEAAKATTATIEP
jgi:hypothetical protein